MVLIATLAGAAAAAATLLVCLAVGVIGWFVADAGGHGAPRDGMRMGALGWLSAHGSGLTVRGVPVGVVPLGLTAICAWAVWRLGHRVGEAVSGHGPDADRISDGERDWTVPTAVAMFFVGYAVVAVVAATLAARRDPRAPGSAVEPAADAGPGRSRRSPSAPVAPRSGRRSSRRPALRRAYGARRARAFLPSSTVALLVALVLDLGEAPT